MLSIIMLKFWTLAIPECKFHAICLFKKIFIRPLFIASETESKHYANSLYYLERCHEKFREQAIFPIWFMANCYFLKNNNNEDLERALYYFKLVASQFYFLNLSALALLHLGLFRYQEEEYIDAKYYFEQDLDLIVSLKLHILWQIYGELLLLDTLP